MLLEEKEALNAARFLRHVEQTPGCWYWRGNLSDCGHGRVRVHGHLRSARRVAYELWVGPIPPDSLVGISCGEKACVRPEHMILKGPLWVARLTPAEVAAIVHCPLPRHHLARNLARIYRVSERHIYRLWSVVSRQSG